MQKGSVQLLLIFVTVILIVGVIYFYQNTNKGTLLQSPATTLKQPEKQPEFNNYSNSEFGFKYSNDLTVEVDSEEKFNKRGSTNFRKNFSGSAGYEPGKFLRAVVVLDQEEKYDSNPFSVWVFDNPNNLTAEAWFDKYWYYPYLWGVFDFTSKGHITPDAEATVSDQVGKSKVVGYQAGEPKYIYISKDKKIYLFRVITETGDQILSTFKFLPATAGRD